MPEPGSKEEKVWGNDDYDNNKVVCSIMLHSMRTFSTPTFVAFLDRSCRVESKYNFIYL